MKKDFEIIKNIPMEPLINDLLPPVDNNPDPLGNLLPENQNFPQP
jgi:hypothetical protein